MTTADKNQIVGNNLALAIVLGLLGLVLFFVIPQFIKDNFNDTKGFIPFLFMTLSYILSVLCVVLALFGIVKAGIADSKG